MEIDFQAIKSAARGRWTELLPVLAGIAPELLDGKHHPCPKCGGTDRFRFSDMDGDGAIICNGCGRTGDGIATVAKLLDVGQGEAARRVAAAVGINGHADVGDPLEAVARSKGLSADALRSYGAVVMGDHIELPAFGPDGKQCSTFSIWPTGSDRRRKGLSARGKPAGVFLPVLDGSPRVPASGETWFLVEGTKDAAALGSLGLLSIGAPTCELSQKFVPLLRGCDVVLVPDRDTAGTEGAEKNAARLYGVAESIRIAALPVEIKEAGGADVRDVLRKPGGEAALRDTLENAKLWSPPGKGGLSAQSDNKPTPEESLETVDDPHRLARLLVNEGRTPEGEPTLVFWRDEWLSWDGAAYRTLPAGEVRGAITRLAKREFDAQAQRMMKSYRKREAAGELKKDEKPPKALKVSRGVVSNTLQALESESLLPQRLEQPAWLDGEGPFPADEALPTESGIVWLPGLAEGKPCRVPPTPRFFARYALPYPFDPEAACPEWLDFLDRLWPDDQASVDALQEWFGYQLTPDTTFQKMLLLVGPSRSGKSTIGRVLVGMLGEANCAAPTLSSLAETFGLWPLVGRLAAVVADARLSGRVDAVSVLERLLSVVGQDPVDVHRKNLPTLPGVRLTTRFSILSNELPSVRDSSGALTARVLLLRLTESWLGREDRGLTDRLLGELPGVLGWSIRGWQRLRARGRFLQPGSGEELLQDLRDIGSPVGQFVEDRCELGPGFEVSAADLFEDWSEWCKQSGRDKPGQIQTFGRDLRAAFPKLTGSQPRTPDGGRVRGYVGIRLKPLL